MEGAGVGVGSRMNGEDNYAFKDLDAVTNLRGNLLRPVNHKASRSGESRGRRSVIMQQKSGETGSIKIGSEGKISSMSGVHCHEYHRGVS
ncbi:hypothetical protein ACFX1X_036150 [Malus domestica]